MKTTSRTSKKLLALKEQPERKATLGSDVPSGLLSQPMSARELARDVEDAIITDNIGTLLRSAREQTQASVRGAAGRIGVSHPRVLAIEQGGSRIECSTLVRFAEALGYEVSVSLQPKSGGGRPLIAKLTPEDLDIPAG